MSKNYFNTNGEIDWNDVETGSGQSSKNLYMRREEGENTVRVMGKPCQFFVHWVNTPDGKKKKIVSPSERNSLTDKPEDAGFRRQSKWFVKILDRNDNEFKVMEVGSQILNGIKALYRNSKWGDVRNYDVSIHKGPKGAQPLYTVTPNPKEKLGSEYKEKYSAFEERLDMDKLTSPTPSSEVCSMLGWNPSEFATGGQDTSGDDDFDFEFE